MKLKSDFSCYSLWYKKIYKKVIERLDKENPANTQGINNETSVGVPNSAVE